MWVQKHKAGELLYTLPKVAENVVTLQDTVSVNNSHNFFCANYFKLTCLLNFVSQNFVFTLLIDICLADSKIQFFFNCYDLLIMLPNSPHVLFFIP